MTEQNGNEQLKDDLKYFEALLLGYDGDDKEIRETLRGKIYQLKQTMGLCLQP